MGKNTRSLIWSSLTTTKWFILNGLSAQKLPVWINQFKLRQPITDLTLTNYLVESYDRIICHLQHSKANGGVEEEKKERNINNEWTRRVKITEVVNINPQPFEY